MLWFHDRDSLGRFKRYMRLFSSVRPSHFVKGLHTIFTAFISCICWLVPPPVQACFPFLFLYASKRRQGRSTLPQLELRQLRPYYQCIEPGYSDSGAGLATLLCYDILILLAHNVHYVDLVNLSLVSKRLRQAVFPLHGGERRLDDRALRLYSCQGSEKSQCWTCGIQICHVS